MKIEIILLLLVLLLTSCDQKTNIDTIKDCAYYAAVAETETKVPARITLALGFDVEAGRNLNHQPVRNKNGTYDLGPGLNSKYLEWYAGRFNGGVKINPTSPESMLIVARILEWNYKALGNWPMAFTAYRWGIEGAKKHGIDIEYVDRVIAAMAKGE
jgi:hypothetical protein